MRGPTLCEQARIQLHAVRCEARSIDDDDAQTHALTCFFGTDTASGLRVSNRQALFTTFDYVTGARALEF